MLRQRREVFGVDGSIVIEIPIIPHHAAQTQVVRERREVFAVHGSIQVGVTEQRVHDFDFAGGQIRRISRIGRIGVAQAINTWI